MTKTDNFQFCKILKNPQKKPIWLEKKGKWENSESGEKQQHVVLWGGYVGLGVATSWSTLG